MRFLRKHWMRESNTDVRIIKLRLGGSARSCENDIRGNGTRFVSSHPLPLPDKRTGNGGRKIAQVRLVQRENARRSRRQLTGTRAQVRALLFYHFVTGCSRTAPSHLFSHNPATSARSYHDCDREDTSEQACRTLEIRRELTERSREYGINFVAYLARRTCVRQTAEATPGRALEFLVRSRN